MIKSIFVGEKYISDTVDELLDVGANHFILVQKAVNNERWRKLKEGGSKLAISLGSFDSATCPLNPESKAKLKERIDNALTLQPDEIWFDHFRFDGHWEALKGKSIPGIHSPCKWCKGKDRVLEITNLATYAQDLVAQNARTGYFAVPFKMEKIKDMVYGLGHDHSVLGKVFDMTSPMLYHRMIDKPVSYISKYVGYICNMAELVLPIIQIKDMPDDIPDKLKWDEFRRVYLEARKYPSSGVSIFYWTHAVERNKIDWIKKVFSIND